MVVKYLHNGGVDRGTNYVRFLYTRTLVKDDLGKETTFL